MFRLPAALGVAIAAVSLSFAAPAAATTWNAVDDFSATQSTLAAGVWSYGWDSGSGFEAYTTNAECFAGLSCWQSPGPNLAYQVPTVAKNITGGLITYAGTVVHPDDVLNLHPGAMAGDWNGQPIESVLRFTAPTDGTYAFDGYFQLLDRWPTGVSILAAGSPVFVSGAATWATEAGPKSAFSGKVALAAGQYIDFRVGPNGSYGSDSTGLSLTVATVPEPASWALMIVGFGAAGMVLRRRRLATA